MPTQLFSFILQQKRVASFFCCALLLLLIGVTQPLGTNISQADDEVEDCEGSVGCGLTDEELAALLAVTNGLGFATVGTYTALADDSGGAYVTNSADPKGEPTYFGSSDITSFGGNSNNSNNNSKYNDPNYDPFAPGEPANTYYAEGSYGDDSKYDDPNYDPFAPGEPANSNYAEGSYSNDSKYDDPNYDPFAYGEPANSNYYEGSYTSGNNKGNSPRFTNDNCTSACTNNAGLRNNNPGNIEYVPSQMSTDPWVGANPVQNGRFVEFEEPELGIRAIFRDINTKNGNDVDTIREIVAVWTDGGEHTTAEINNKLNTISETMGIGLDTQFDVSDATLGPAFVKGLITTEVGPGYYSDQQILDGYTLAFSYSPSNVTGITKAASEMAEGSSYNTGIVISNGNTQNGTTACCTRSIVDKVVDLGSSLLGVVTNNNNVPSNQTDEMTLAKAQSVLATEKAQYAADELALTSSLSLPGGPSLEQAQALDDARENIKTKDSVITEGRIAASQARAAYNQAELEFTSSLSRPGGPSLEQAQALDDARKNIEVANEYVAKATIAAAKDDILEATVNKAYARQASFNAEVETNTVLGSRRTSLSENDVVSMAYSYLSERYSGAYAAKDDRAAAAAGYATTIEFVMNIDPKFAVNLMEAIKEMERLGVIAPGEKILNAGFRDEYRQTLATASVKACNTCTWHGANPGTGGIGLAVDLNSNAANWIGENGSRYGLAQPYGSYDTPHITPANSPEVQGRSGRVGGMTTEAVESIYSDNLAKNTTGDFLPSFDFSDEEKAAIAALSIRTDSPQFPEAQEAARDAISKTEQAAALEAQASRIEEGTGDRSSLIQAANKLRAEAAISLENVMNLGSVAESNTTANAGGSLFDTLTFGVFSNQDSDDGSSMFDSALGMVTGLFSNQDSGGGNSILDSVFGLFSNQGSGTSNPFSFLSGLGGQSGNGLFTLMKLLGFGGSSGNTGANDNPLADFSHSVNTRLDNNFDDTITDLTVKALKTEGTITDEYRFKGSLTVKAKNRQYRTTIANELKLDLNCDGTVEKTKKFSTPFSGTVSRNSISEVLLSEYMEVPKIGLHCFAFTVDTKNAISEANEVNNTSEWREFITNFDGNVENLENNNTLPVFTFEVSSYKDGEVVTDWQNADISVKTDEELAFRWNAPQYDNCLPFISPTNYSFVGNIAPISRDTKAENIDIRELTKSYVVQCSRNGEERTQVIDVTVRKTDNCYDDGVYKSDGTTQNNYTDEDGFEHTISDASFICENGEWEIDSDNSSNTPIDSLTPCTMDVKICPDGSAVARSGPTCSFAACPSEEQVSNELSCTSDKGVTYQHDELDNDGPYGAWLPNRCCYGEWRGSMGNAIGAPVCSSSYWPQNQN